MERRGRRKDRGATVPDQIDQARVDKRLVPTARCLMARLVWYESMVLVWYGLVPTCLVEMSYLGNARWSFQWPPREGKSINDILSCPLASLLGFSSKKGVIPRLSAYVMYMNNSIDRIGSKFWHWRGWRSLLRPTLRLQCGTKCGGVFKLTPTVDGVEAKGLERKLPLVPLPIHFHTRCGRCDNFHYGLA